MQQQQQHDQVVLIINMYDKENYAKDLEDNLNFWRVPYEIYGYASFGAIDFALFSHIILTGSDFFVPTKRVLSRAQVATLLAVGKPVLAQCYGFHLLAYYYGGPALVQTFVKKHTETMCVRSPLVSLENKKYFLNHRNYVVPAELLMGRTWDIISEAVYVDGDGRRKRYVVDAMMRAYPVLCLQYHPEATEANYTFLHKWLNHTF